MTKKLAVVLIALLVVISFSACDYKITDGEKVGTVIKLSQTGLVCKTWESELIRGGLANGSGGFSTTPLYFTVDNENLLTKVRYAMENQVEVKVTFWEPLWNPCGSTSGNYLKDIKALDGRALLVQNP